jgi:succinate dehydrogenase/fumarate reductase cytochrome b subunit
MEKMNSTVSVITAIVYIIAGYHSDNAVRHFTFQVKLNTIENRRIKLDTLNVRMYDFSHTALVQHIAQKQPKDRTTLKSTKR